MMNSEIHRIQYEEELAQRTAIESAVGLPITTATILAGAVYVLVTSMHYQDESLVHVFLIFSVLAFLSLMCSIFFLIRVIYGYEYFKVASASDLHRYYNTLFLYWQHNDPNNAQAYTDKDFSEYLEESYEKAIDKNADNNRSKFSRLHRAKQFLIVSLFFTFIIAFVTVYHVVFYDKEPILVKVLGSESTSCTTK